MMYQGSLRIQSKKITQVFCSKETELQACSIPSHREICCYHVTMRTVSWVLLCLQQRCENVG